MEKKILLESKTESLNVVEKIIDEFAVKYSIAGKFYGNIQIAAFEIVQNAIQHGNKFDPQKLVELRLKMENDRLVIITKDQGEGFDFNNVPDPTAPENIEKTSGRGIFLLRNLADRLSFYDNGRISELVFNIPTSRVLQP
jgi:serine/threonine-protein kinase RsbW